VQKQIEGKNNAKKDKKDKVIQKQRSSSNRDQEDQVSGKKGNKKMITDDSMIEICQGQADDHKLELS
jgi:hypothetical protein